MAGAAHTGGEFREILVGMMKISRYEGQVHSDKQVQETREDAAKRYLLRNSEACQPKQGRQDDQAQFEQADCLAEKVGKHNIEHSYRKTKKSNCQPMRTPRASFEILSGCNKRGGDQRIVEEHREDEHRHAK